MNKREQVLSRVLDSKVVAVVRLNSEKNVMGMTHAFAEGGITNIEVTLTTPNALEIISSLNKEFGNEVVVGVGSVLNREMSEKAIEAGAKFIVSPIFKEEIICSAHDYDLPVMVGAFTPTEIQTAWEKGADVVKVFPADVLGMKFFKGVLAPMPHLKLMPTGGVNLDNPGEWLKSGACAVGIGSALVDKAAIEAGDFEKIKQNSIRAIKAANSI